MRLFGVLRAGAAIGGVAIALAGPAAAAPAGASEHIEIAAGETTLKGVLFRPAGEGPVAAVVALHGCAGAMTPRGELRPIYRDWGERLSAAGYAVMFPDSFGSRGVGSQCQVRGRHIRPRRERMRDAEAARGWLQAQSWVKPERVFLIGWSNGGTTTLWTIRANGRVRAEAQRVDFRSAVAFYPGCRLPREAGWTARVPTLVLIGRADDWTPAAPCEGMVAEARGRSAQAEIVVYPGAYHGFDLPAVAVRERHGLAYTADGSGKAHIGTEPAAREDAIRRVMAWLAR